MAINDKVNGAYQEIETLKVPVNGAYQEADHANALVNDAWQEVWSAMKWLKQLESTLTVAEAMYATSGSHKYKIWYIGGYDENDGGYVTYYLEGDFTNPTLSFEYEGYYNYTTSSGADRYSSAGSIERYTRTKDGVENYYEIVLSVNTADTDAQLFSTQLYGEYDRIGIRIDLSSWSGGNNADYLDYFIEFWNLRIDGKECLPSEDCVIRR